MEINGKFPIVFWIGLMKDRKEMRTGKRCFGREEGTFSENLIKLGLGKR